MSDKRTVGFVGIGVMGLSMAGHILDGGAELHVYTRTASKARPLVERGATLESSPAELAAKCDVVFSIVGFPQDVEQVYLGADGMVAHARPGALLIDMTTSSPELARRIYDESKERGVHAMDAPVTGGDRGAREGTLTIFAGGDEEDFKSAEPFFKMMGRTIVRMGGPGAGQSAKLANQIAIAGTMTGMCEAMAFARASGLDEAQFIEAAGGGSAASWSLANYGPRILKGDFAPGFFIKHYIKDLKLAEGAAREMEQELPALFLTRELYERAASMGMNDLGTQALYKIYGEE